jgi:hypothetical protein
MLKMLISLFVFAVWKAAEWRMYEKAGQKGWISLIPILSTLGKLKMIGKPFWWIVFYLPPITPVAHFVVSVMVARRFGKSALFGVGYSFFPMAFAPFMGLSQSARYIAPPR